ncbi:MAG: enoyl-CoA hydratase/isomerase family protein [Betaproteobacteria bacterium]|nr:enoyl-CoA hydratase/isomerase family protein [Betaproteobacteria bacterium]
MDELLYEVRDGVGYVTFNRPQARNALTFAMYERLGEICNEASEKRSSGSSVRAILMTGAADKAFAAGTDISQFRTFDKEEDALQYEERIDRVMTAIERCKVPTIAAIHGACTGGGASIAACCDLRVASRAMKYGFPVARTLGNCLSLASYNRHAPLTLQATKEALLRLRPKIAHGEGNDLVLMCYMSQDFREGMDAFLNKRKPVWKAR